MKLFYLACKFNLKELAIELVKNTDKNKIKELVNLHSTEIFFSQHFFYITPLFFAVYHKNDALIEFLLISGANHCGKSNIFGLVIINNDLKKHHKYFINFLLKSRVTLDANQLNSIFKNTPAFLFVNPTVNLNRELPMLEISRNSDLNRYWKIVCAATISGYTNICECIIKSLPLEKRIPFLLKTKIDNNKKVRESLLIMSRDAPYYPGYAEENNLKGTYSFFDEEYKKLTGFDKVMSDLIEYIHDREIEPEEYKRSIQFFHGKLKLNFGFSKKEKIEAAEALLESIKKNNPSLITGHIAVLSIGRLGNIYQKALKYQRQAATNIIKTLFNHESSVSAQHQYRSGQSSVAISSLSMVKSLHLY